MLKKLYGKWAAAKALATQARYLANWRDVFEAYRTERTIPPLVTRKGTRLEYTPGSDPIMLFLEIWKFRCYTTPGFYTPRPGQSVVDLGANLGFLALYLCEQAPGIRVHCFEPAKATRDQLLRNVEVNGLGHSVSVYPYAVSDRLAEAQFHVPGNSVLSSLFETEFSGSQVETVECIPLSRAIELTGVDRIDLLKIDVEGAEIEIVEGATPGDWARIDRVVAEYHDHFRPGCLDHVSTALRAAGYRVIDKPVPNFPGLGMLEAVRDAPRP